MNAFEATGRDDPKSKSKSTVIVCLIDGTSVVVVYGLKSGAFKGRGPEDVIVLQSARKLGFLLVVT